MNRQTGVKTVPCPKPRLRAVMTSRCLTFACWHVNDVTDKSVDGHLIIIQQPERFLNSDGHPKSMNKLTLNGPVKC